jgi:acetyltransferase
MPEVCTTLADTVNELLAEGRKIPTYVCWVSTRNALANMDLLQKKRVPCFDWPERTAKAVAGIADYADFLKSRGVDISKR